MNIRVFYHAFLREKLGRESELFAISPEEATAGGVVRAFMNAHSEFKALAAALNVAVDDEIVSRDDAVSEGTRIDLLPPYGGG